MAAVSARGWNSWSEDSCPNSCLVWNCWLRVWMMYFGRPLQSVRRSCFIALGAACSLVLAPMLLAQSAQQRELAESARRAENDRWNSSAAIEQRAQDFHESATRMRDAMRGYSDHVAISKSELQIWAESIQAKIEAEAAKVRAEREAAAEKIRLAEESRQEALYRANEEKAKAARAKAEAEKFSRLTYWQMHKDEQHSCYNLCLVYLGIHPDFPPSMHLGDPVSARELLYACVESNDPEVLALVWDSIVAKGPHAAFFKQQGLDFQITLSSLKDGTLAPVGDLLAGDWMRASLSDRVLVTPALRHLHVMAYQCWQREVSLMIIHHPANADSIFKVMGSRLPVRLMSHLTAEATGSEAVTVSQCLMAYAILCGRQNHFPKEPELTRRAVSLAQTLNSPYLLYKLYSLSGDPRRWPALRAALAEKAPSAECLRSALSLASQDPELIRLRETDPDLLTEEAPLRHISQYAMMLASLEQPFDVGENDTFLVGTLADLAARSLFHKELTAAIPLLVAKARKAHCEALVAQLGLVELGLRIRRGALDPKELPRLHALALQKIPVDKLSYDDLLGFTPNQAAACLQAPQTRAPLLELLRTLSGQGSWKATEALRLAGDHSLESSEQGRKPRALPL